MHDLSSASTASDTTQQGAMLIEVQKMSEHIALAFVVWPRDQIIRVIFV